MDSLNNVGRVFSFGLEGNLLCSAIGVAVLSNSGSSDTVGLTGTSSKYLSLS